jgi:glycosyltransferase involved in cell wall biosynthesis
VVIHDPSAFPGERLRDRVRGYVQHSTMRWLRRAARAVVVTVPVDRVAWLSHVERGTLRFIPVGANIEPGPDARPGAQGLFTLTVFGVTQGKWKEIEDIAAVARRVADELGGLKLVVVGRGSEDAEPHLRSLLRNAKLHLEVGGVESANRVSRLLSMSDACLCVRGGISSRRGTVVAAIAHGLPVVGYVCAETGPPVTNAGVVLVPAGDVEGLARALIQIARDRSWSDTLRDRNRRAYEAHFAWDRIAAAWEGCLTRQPATY